jgi:Na+-driven multidrug efflux pump
MKRFKCIGSVYFFVGVMEVLGGGLKGMGKTISSMLINLFTMCGFRVLWIFTICAMIPNNIYVLYISYPVSQFITIVISAIFIKVVLNKFKKEKMINECLEGL